jgi:hypothetical protein
MFPIASRLGPRDYDPSLNSTETRSRSARALQSTEHFAVQQKHQLAGGILARTFFLRNAPPKIFCGKLFFATPAKNFCQVINL